MRWTAACIWMKRNRAEMRSVQFHLDVSILVGGDQQHQSGVSWLHVDGDIVHMGSSVPGVLYSVEMLLNRISLSVPPWTRIAHLLIGHMAGPSSVQHGSRRPHTHRTTSIKFTR